MKVALEIRPGEGGDDAKLLVTEQAAIYAAYAKRHALTLEEADEGRSWLTITLEGEDGLIRPLLKESGGHRWQRIPPTERRGRVHTSTVTVAAFPLVEQTAYKLRDSEIEIFTTVDSGPGGQHRNKTESAVIMRHKPTGIEAKSATKSQHQNRRMARQVLEARVAAHFAAISQKAEADQRKAMVGSGMRGDKVRTYREQDDQCTDHRSNRKARLCDVRAGRLEALA